MFDQLFSLVKENAGQAIINNSDIPNERNDEAVEAATRSISDTFTNALQSGKTQDVMQLFNSGDAAAAQPLAQGMQGNFADKLMQQFGLSGAQAGGIASSLIPMVLNQFIRKTNDPSDSSFDLSSILGSLGGKNFDAGAILSQFGLGKNSGDGGGLPGALKNIFGK